MVNQVESYCRCFPDMKPGFVYDKDNHRIVGHVAAPSTISSTEIEPLVAIREKSLKNLIEPENEKNFVWFEEFERSDEKNCFLLSITGITIDYIDKLKSLESVAEGTVTEVKYQKCLKMLVCSSEESSFDECCEYLKKVLEGNEAELSSKVCESCKKCYIYNLYLTRERKIQDFTSIMSCFKEVTRIIDEMKFSTNFELFSFKYVIQMGSNDLPLCSNSEDWKTNVEDCSKIVPGNICSEGSKNSSQRFDKCSDFTTEEAEKNTCNHSEATVHKVQSFKKRTKIDKDNSTGQFNEITAAKRSSKKKNSEVLISKIDSKKSIRGKEYYKAQKNKFDQFQNFGSENSFFQKVEGIEVSMALSESISDDFEMSNSENGLVEVNPSSQSKGFPYSKENSKFDSNTLEPFCCDTENINSYEGMSSSEINTRQTGTFMKRNKSLNSVIPLLHSYSKEDEQLEALTDDPEGNIKFFEDSKVENNCENSLFENDVGLKDGNRDVCVTHDQLEPDLRNEISHEEKLEPRKTPIQSSFSIASLEGHNIQKQTIYYREIKIILTITDLNGIRKVEIGNRMREGKGKVIILLGATGSGKTSLVNLCANFYFGAKNADEEKLFVVDPKTKTDRVTVYTFYPEEEGQAHLTVVDTPGLNDSTGAEIHDHVDALKSFLALACSQGLEINALAFVAQTHLVRLTSSEKLVMDYVRSLFGSEVEKHIMALVTFSDNQPTPPVIEAMEQYGFKSPFFVKFNNTLISKTEAVDDLDRIYWRTGMRSWRKCVRHLSTIESLSNCAIASVKNEVFNKAVLNKYQSNLDAEIRNFIILCNKNIEIEEFYYDQGLISSRNKLWIASNDAYNVEANVTAINKELFLINACHIHLENDLISVRPAIIKLFLLMHKESSLRCVLKCLVSALLKCLYNFNVHSNSKENYLSILCNICSKYRKYEKVCYDKDENETKFKCSSCGEHWPPQNDSKLPNLRFLTQRQLYMHTACLIRNEVSKYKSLNCGVEGFWTVGEVLRNMQLSEPFEYQHDEINIILEKLYTVAEEERL